MPHELAFVCSLIAEPLERGCADLVRVGGARGVLGSCSRVFVSHLPQPEKRNHSQTDVAIVWATAIDFATYQANIPPPHVMLSHNGKPDGDRTIGRREVLLKQPRTRKVKPTDSLATIASDLSIEYAAADMRTEDTGSFIHVETNGREFSTTVLSQQYMHLQSNHVYSITLPLVPPLLLLHAVSLTLRDWKGPTRQLVFTSDPRTVPMAPQMVKLIAAATVTPPRAAVKRKHEAGQSSSGKVKRSMVIHSPPPETRSAAKQLVRLIMGKTADTTATDSTGPSPARQKKRRRTPSRSLEVEEAVEATPSRRSRPKKAKREKKATVTLQSVEDAMEEGQLSDVLFHTPKFEATPLMQDHDMVSLSPEEMGGAPPHPLDTSTSSNDTMLNTSNSSLDVSAFLSPITGSPHSTPPREGRATRASSRLGGGGGGGQWSPVLGPLMPHGLATPLTHHILQTKVSGLEPDSDKENSISPPNSNAAVGGPTPRRGRSVYEPLAASQWVLNRSVNLSPEVGRAGGNGNGGGAPAAAAASSSVALGGPSHGPGQGGWFSSHSAIHARSTRLPRQLLFGDRSIGRHCSSNMRS